MVFQRKNEGVVTASSAPLRVAVARIRRKRLKTACFGTRRGLSVRGTDFPLPITGRYVYMIKAPAPRQSTPKYLQAVSEAVF